MSKKVFFIIGMHRSGTSALTSMFAKGGMDLGKSLMLPGPDNPRGFFENKKIVQFNDDLLAKLNASWDVPFNVDFDEHTLAKLHSSYNQLEKLILEDFGDEDIVIKDPRLSKLLPFYLPYFRKKGFEMQAIVCLRNPIEVIQSLNRAHGTQFDHSAWMWMSYMFDAEFYSRDIKRKFIHYDELISNPKSVFRRLKKFMGVGIDYAEDIAISPILRHFRFEEEDEHELPTIALEVLDIYDSLCAIGKADNNKRRTEFEESSYPWNNIVNSVFSPNTIPYHKAAQLNKYSRIQLNVGRGINKWDARTSVVKNQLASYECHFNLKSFGEIQEIKWFPLIDDPCKIRFPKITLENFDGTQRELDVSFDANAENVTDGYLYFEGEHDGFTFNINGAYKSVVFKGEVELINSEKNSPKFKEQAEALKSDLTEAINSQENLKATIAAMNEEVALAKKEVVHVGNWRREKNELTSQLERLKEIETKKNEQLRVIVGERDRLKELLEEVKQQAEQSINTAQANLNQDYISKHEGLLQYRDDLIDQEIADKRDREELLSMFESAKSDLQNVRAENEVQKQTQNELAQQINSISEENTSLHKTILEKQERVEVLEELHDEVNSEKRSMEDELMRLKKSVKKLTKSRKGWKKLKKTFKKELALQSEENKSLFEVVENYEDKYKKKKAKIEKLEIKLHAAYEKLQDEESARVELSNQLQKDNQSWQETISELETLDEKHRDVLMQLEISQNTIESFKTDLESADNRILELNDAVKAANDNVSLLTEQYHLDREVLENDIEQMLKEHEMHQDAMAARLDELNEAQRKIEKQKFKYKSLSIKHEELNQLNQIAESLVLLDGEEESYAWDSVFSELNAKNIQASQLSSIVEELNEQLEGINQKFLSSEGKNQSMLAKIESLETKIEDMDSYATLQQSNLGELSESAEEMTNQIAWFENDRSEKELSISNLNAALEQAQESIRIKETESQSQIVSLNKDLEKAQELIRTLEAESRNNRISLDAKRALVEDLKSDLLRKQEDLYKASRERMRFENEWKAVLFHISGLKNSLSYKLGFGLTSPLRFIYNQVSNKPFRKSLIGKPLVAEPKEYGALDMPGEDAQIIEESAFTYSDAPDLAVPNVTYNVEDVVLEKAPEHPAMKIDHNKMGSVLFISPNLPDYDESSGGKRATRMLELLTDDFNVFVFTLGDKPRKYIDKLRSLGVNVLETSRYDKAKALLPKIDCIIYAWYYTYFDAEAFRDMYPDAQIILDSVDVHWLREARSIGLLEGLTHEIAAQNKQREILAYKGASVIWVVTAEDRLEVLKEIPNADVRVVSNIHDAAEDVYRKSPEKNILFLGGYRHYPNISAAITLATEILPIVRAQIPNAKLILAGSHAPPEIMELGHLDGVEFKGFIEDEDLEDLYRKSFLIATPLKAGAGIKGKICEAIVHRVPVVTNDIGNEGINLVTGEDGFISNDVREMATQIVDVMSGKYNLAEITERAMNKLLQIVGPGEAKKSMLNSIYPEVSICVVTWNRLELLEKCVDSVLKETSYPRYKLIVHSNGCEDGTREYLTEVSKKDNRVIPILSDTNDVFVIPNNNMMDMYKDNDAILLNNDTIVTANWLTALHHIAYSDPKIGISGSKLLYPDGTLQEFGSELYANGSGRNIGKWDDPNKPEYNEVREVGYVSGCSLYLKRATLDKVGYFDEQFHPCYCEDSDLCYTAKEHGLITVVTPKSVVYHFEGGTSGTDTDSGFKSYQKINMVKFMDKHRGKPNGINWEEENS